MRIIDSIQDKIETVYQELDRGNGGVFSVLMFAFDSFGKARASEAAAAMAYYAIFSIFPFLLIITALASQAIISQTTQEQIIQFTESIIPVSSDLIEETIDKLLRQNIAFGLIGGLSLVWSASGYFSALVNNIHRAWPDAEPRHFIVHRVLGMAVIVIILFGLLVLAVGSNVALKVLPTLDFLAGDYAPLFETLIWRVSSVLVPFLFTFLLFLFLYRWIPNLYVRWSAGIWGALVAALAWGLATNLFGWYFSSGFASFNVLFGSLGAVVALLLWIFMTNQIVLFGAHLTSAVGRHQQKRNGGHG